VLKSRAGSLSVEAITQGTAGRLAAQGENGQKIRPGLATSSPGGFLR